ncbi:MAG TPA: 50S ribosomal protein L22 [Flavisolibacter sp.]|jgi:large subunit ribosomal protein L22|nr:50S ribosomal protein L22 [Flavisolibacter sp.]
MEAVARLRNYPTSPRKMRLIADLIRGMKVDRALGVLEFNPKHSSEPVRKLLLSAISNWKQKNEGGNEADLYVTTIMVDGARTLKRMRPAPQGRGYKIRKRSNHVTLMVDNTPTAKELKKTAAKKTYSSKVKNNSNTPAAPVAQAN